MISATSQTAFQHSPSALSVENTADSSQSLSRNRRNIGEPAKYWPQNSTIKIAMFDYEMDDPYVLAVKQAASEWLPHINLKFEFVSGEEGDVRITQNPGGRSGGLSAFGTDARDIAAGWPTMSLPRNHLDPRFKHLVLHEFGHMLGAHHAHQHPDANIPWNHDRVYDHYRRNENMNRQDVQNHVLALPRSTTYDFLPYDGDSVMHYDIRPGLTDGNWGQSESGSLSDGDIAWAKKAYPKTQQ